MKNWETTVCGIFAAIFAALAQAMPNQATIFNSLAQLSTAALGYFAASINNPVLTTPAPPAK